MSTQQADLLARIHAADLTVEEFARKAKRIQERVSRLEESQRLGMPGFNGPWTKEAIQVHLERVEEWVRTPVRATNRRRLESLGILGTDIKPEIFDDSDFLDEVVADVQRIVSTCTFVKPYLLADECLPAWLSNGEVETRQKLLSMKERLEGYKRLNAIPLAPKHQEDLMRRAISDGDKLAAALATAKQIESVQQHGIAVPESEGVTTFETALIAISENLRTLQSRFPEQLETLSPSLQGQPLADAQKVVAAEAERCGKEYSTLSAEWNSLERTLRLLGGGCPEPAVPRTLFGLQEQIAEFRKQCSDKVGVEGMSLLTFLQGDSDFPPDLSLKAIRSALLSLRPLIVISSRAGV